MPLKREHRSGYATYEDQTEGTGYPFLTRPPSDNGPPGDRHLIAGAIRLMFGRNISFDHGGQIDRLEALGGLDHPGIASQLP
jgi:hypothetical protein